MVDLLNFFIFAVFSSVVWVVAGCTIFRALLRRFGVKAGKPWGSLSKRGKGYRSGVFFLCALYIVALVWSFVEPYYPKLEKVEITSNKVKDTLRIVHISDTHCDPERRAEDRVIAMVQSVKPDLILFTGDGVNSNEGIAQFKRLMRKLSAIAPLYGVRGNWEAWWFTDTDTFANTGIIELNNTPKSVQIRNQKVWIIGAPVDGEGPLRQRARALPKSSFRIGLHHFPAAIERLDGAVDLMVSGDTHGGQIALPFVGPLIKIRRWNDPYYFAGKQTTAAGTHLYVNRGIGMEGRHVPRVRFLVPPEVTLIEISPPS